MRGRNYSPCTTLERMRRFWVCCRQYGSYPETGLWEATRIAFQDADKGQLAMAESRSLIALHSPNARLETGLRKSHPEKSQYVEAMRYRAVRSLQSGLCANNREIRACFAYVGAE
jgi:hypothetical protein